MRLKAPEEDPCPTAHPSSKQDSIPDDNNNKKKYPHVLLPHLARRKLCKFSLYLLTPSSFVSNKHPNFNLVLLFHVNIYTYIYSFFNKKMSFQF